MRYGPNYIYKCPNCGNLLKKRSLSSGNTLGAEVFSDGKRIAPMLREFPNLTKCKKCGSFFWLSKLQEIGTYEWGQDENPLWENADEAEFLRIDEYFAAINTGIAENDKEELEIRQRIWWSFNDRLRDNRKIFIDEGDELNWRMNINELMKLIDQTDNNKIIVLAELNRNLGNFEKCISLIQSIDNEKYIWIKEKFLAECEQKHKYVIKLN